MPEASFAVKPSICGKCARKPCLRSVISSGTLPRLTLARSSDVSPSCPIKVPPTDAKSQVRQANAAHLKQDMLSFLGFSPQVHGFMVARDDMSKFQSLIHSGAALLLDPTKRIKPFLEYQKSRVTHKLEPPQKIEVKDFTPAPPPVLNPALISPEWFQTVEKESGPVDEAATHIPEGLEAIMVVDSQDLKAHEIINFTAFRADNDEEVGKAQGKTGHYNESYKVAAGKFNIPKNLATGVKPEKMEIYFVATHKKHSLEVKSPALEVIPRIKATFSEFPSSLFNDNSAIPCLDEDKTIISSLMAIFKYAKDNTSSPVYVFGHTESSDQFADNAKLSKKRAEAVKALLDNSPDDWCAATSETATIKDAKSFLWGLGFNCGDPESTGDDVTPEFESSMENFKTGFNTGHEDLQLDINSDLDDDTLKAFFTILQELLAKAWKNFTADEELPTLNFGSESDAISGFGESFGVEDDQKGNYIGEGNKRVEVHFYEEGYEPKNKPAAESKIPPEDADSYNPFKTERVPLKLEPWDEWTFLIEYDGETEIPDDDEVKLVDADGIELQVVKLKEMEIIEEDDTKYIVVVFPEEVDRDTKYSIIRDLNGDEEGGEFPLVLEMTPREMTNSEPVLVEDEEE